MKKKVNGEHGEVEIEAKSLDSLKLPDVGFIKIDVEGFEQEVLEGAKQTIAQHRPTLLIEMEERHTKTPIEQSLDYVKNLGYDAFCIINNRLLPITYFDPVKNHRQTDAGNQYVFNFIFIPNP